MREEGGVKLFQRPFVVTDRRCSSCDISFRDGATSPASCQHMKTWKKDKVLVQGAFGQKNKSRRSLVHFTLVKHLTTKYRTHKHFKSHHDANYVENMEGAQNNNFKFYQTNNGCVICFDTIPKEYIKKVIHIRDRGSHESQDSRFSCTHTIEKDASDNVVEPDKGYFLCNAAGVKRVVSSSAWRPLKHMKSCFGLGSDLSRGNIGTSSNWKALG